MKKGKFVQFIAALLTACLLMPGISVSASETVSVSIAPGVYIDLSEEALLELIEQFEQIERWAQLGMYDEAVALLIDTSDDFVLIQSAAEVITGEFSGTVIVNVPGVSLEEAVIDGDLIITEAVGDGRVYLYDVEIGGTLLIRGGGENSIFLRGRTLSSNVWVDSYGYRNLRVRIGRNAQVRTVDITSGRLTIDGAEEPEYIYGYEFDYELMEYVAVRAAYPAIVMSTPRVEQINVHHSLHLDTNVRLEIAPGVSVGHVEFDESFPGDEVVIIIRGHIETLRIPPGARVLLAEGVEPPVVLGDDDFGFGKYPDDYEGNQEGHGDGYAGDLPIPLPIPTPTPQDPSDSDDGGVTATPTPTPTPTPSPTPVRVFTIYYHTYDENGEPVIEEGIDPASRARRITAENIIIVPIARVLLTMGFTMTPQSEDCVGWRDARVWEYRYDEYGYRYYTGVVLSGYLWSVLTRGDDTFKFLAREHDGSRYFLHNGYEVYLGTYTRICADSGRTMLPADVVLGRIGYTAEVSDDLYSITIYRIVKDSTNPADPVDPVATMETLELEIEVSESDYAYTASDSYEPQDQDSLQADESADEASSDESDTDSSTDEATSGAEESADTYESLSKS